MVERHIISPSAGRMRPKTSESGIFNTNRNKPVSTSMLTRILVPNPKNAFQSPAVHKAGPFISDAFADIICSYRSGTRFQIARGAFAPRQIVKEKPDIRSRIGRFMTIRALGRPASWREPSEREAQAPIADPNLAVRGCEGIRGAGKGLSEQQAIVDDVVVLDATLGVPGAPPRRDQPIQRLLQGETGREHAGIAERARRGGGQSATRHASVPVAARTDRDPGRRRDRQWDAGDVLQIQRRHHADFDVIRAALVADDDGRAAGDRVEQLDVGVEGERPAGERAVVEPEIRFDVALLLEVAGRTDERDVSDAGLPIFAHGPIGADPPVELVPGPDRVKLPGRYSIRPARHRILLAP